jgi:hypothetical protein
MGVFVGEHFEEEDAWEAVLDEDGAVLPFAQEEAEAASLAGRVEMEQGRFIQEAHHLVTPRELELARLSQPQVKGAGKGSADPAV